jgi:hypothetical protein
MARLEHILMPLAAPRAVERQEHLAVLVVMVRLDCWLFMNITGVNQNGHHSTVIYENNRDRNHNGQKSNQNCCSEINTMRILFAIMLLFVCNCANAQPYGFRADKGGSAQTNIPNAQYGVITFPNAEFNQGDYFSTSTWKWCPPAGLVIMSSQISLYNDIATTGNPGFTLKFFKNPVFNGSLISGGTDLPGGNGGPSLGWTYPPANMQAVAIDVANGSDCYAPGVYATSASGSGDMTMDGNPSHVYFQGIAFPQDNLINGDLLRRGGGGMGGK